MDVYVIRHKNGTKETFLWYHTFKQRVSILESSGLTKGIDFVTYQQWL